MLNERRTQYRYSTYSRQQQKVSPRSKGASELSLFHAPSLSHSSNSLFRGEWERARDPHEPKSCQRGEMRERKSTRGGEKESNRETERESADEQKRASPRKSATKYASVFPLIFTFCFVLSLLSTCVAKRAFP